MRRKPSKLRRVEFDSPYPLQSMPDDLRLNRRTGSKYAKATNAPENDIGYGVCTERHPCLHKKMGLTMGWWLMETVHLTGLDPVLLRVRISPGLPELK